MVSGKAVSAACPQPRKLTAEQVAAEHDSRILNFPSSPQPNGNAESSVRQVAPIHEVGRRPRNGPTSKSRWLAQVQGAAPAALPRTQSDRCERRQFWIR